MSQLAAQDPGELFEVYFPDGCYRGRWPRKECHGNNELIHRAVQVAVRHSETGDWLLQKRSQYKDIQPGKWDTACGGHLQIGENYLTAAVREIAEELGITITPADLTWLFDMEIRNDIESEDLRVFVLDHTGPFVWQASEIDDVRFFSMAELNDPENQELFTPNLRREIAKL